MVKALIFDMDGVLVDNTRVHQKVFEMFCERYGTTIDDRVFASLAGMGNDEIIPRLLPREIVEREGVDRLAEAKEALYREYYAATILPTPGLQDFLQQVREAGIPCAVGSSGPRANVDFVLEHCNIVSCFDVIVSGSMVTRCKPDPEIFLTAARLLGFPPQECLVFEDALSGIRAARSAGMGVVALATTLSVSELEKQGAPDLIIPDFRGISIEAIRSL